MIPALVPGPPAAPLDFFALYAMGVGVGFLFCVMLFFLFYGITRAVAIVMFIFC